MKPFDLRTFHRQRLRNQVVNLLTSISALVLVSGWIAVGCVLGVYLGRWLPFASEGAVILTTLLGFAAGIVTSCALAPRTVTLAFRARPVRGGRWSSLLEELKSLSNGLDFDLYSVDQNAYTGFGHNVVVTGLPRGKGPFRPAILASQSVLERCSLDELHAIFAHELAHLQARHLSRRVLSAVVTGLLGSLCASFILIGMQLLGWKAAAALFATVAALLPVSLVWFGFKRQLVDQEKEADWIAVRDFDARPLDLLNALKKLTLWNESEVHPLIRERMLILQGLWLSSAVEQGTSVSENRLAA